MAALQVTMFRNECPGAPADPVLSVVVPAGRAGEATAACLQSLACQDLPGDRFEVVLVLDGISPPEACHNRNLRIYSLDPQRGRSAARNCGIRHARGPVIVSLDSDMLASPQLLSQYLAAHQRGAVAAIGVRKFLLPSSGLRAATPPDFEQLRAACLDREDYREWFYEATDYLRKAAEPFWAFSTCNCSYPRELALRVGLFDEQAQGWGGEDQEFGYRLWRTGELPFVYLPRAVAIHVEHERDQESQRRTSEANREYFRRKHGELFRDPDSRMATPLLSG